MADKSSRVDDPYFIKELSTRINLKPNQFKNLEKNIYETLKNKVEGRNQSCGYINTDSCVIIKRSNGYFRGSHLTGEMTFDINYIAEVCYPMRGDIVVSSIADINEGGLIAINGPIVMFAPKDYKNNYSFFEQGINLGSVVKFSVVDSKSQLYDNTIDTIVEIVEILDDNKYIDNNSNRIKLKNLNNDNLDYEVRNINNLNKYLFGYDNNFELIQNKYNKHISNDNNGLICSFVNKYELVNPNNLYHEKLMVKNINTNDNTFFEIIELNNYYDLFLRNNNQEKFLFFNNNNHSMIKSVMYLRDNDGNTDKYISQIEPNSKVIKHNNVSVVNHQFGSDNSISNMEKNVNTILFDSDNYSNKENEMLILLKYCFNGLIENGNLIVKTNFIFSSFTYKVISYLSMFFNECHYVRPECVKDNDDTCYLVYKFFKIPSKEQIKNHNDLLNNADFNDFKNISIDKYNLKDILLFNSKNAKQIYYKSLTKINNLIHNNPNDEDKQKRIDEQKNDAQKWFSYFLIN